MSKCRVCAVQMKCSESYLENLKKAEDFVISASEKADIILLPELFERQYFCQERRYDYYDFAESVSDCKAVSRMLKLSKTFNKVIIVSFYEKDVNAFYNSVAVVDCGKLLGVYRKTHIPDDHYYQEKFYFSVGNTGFKVFETTFGKIGVGICWDQWFPEAARCMALLGAELLFYPTAIGSEPILNTDSMLHWRRVMQGHSAANVMPVIAANRIGKEDVLPCAENNNQSSSLVFYGSSFATDETGEVVSFASRDKEECIFAEYDLGAISKMRAEWGLFRDRVPLAYKKITE